MSNERSDGNSSNPEDFVTLDRDAIEDLQSRFGADMRIRSRRGPITRLIEAAAPRRRGDGDFDRDNGDFDRDNGDFDRDRPYDRDYDRDKPYDRDYDRDKPYDRDYDRDKPGYDRDTPGYDRGPF